MPSVPELTPAESLAGDEQLYIVQRGRDRRTTIDAIAKRVVAERGPQGPRGEKGDAGGQGPKGDRGERGSDGKDVDPAAIRAMVAEAFAAVPKPKDGERGPKGDPGANGRDADPELIRAIVTEIVGRLPPAKDGPPGDPGLQGVPGPRGMQGAQGLKGDPADTSYSRIAPATGFNQTLNTTTLFVDPADASAPGTVTLPASPADGQQRFISTTLAITPLTIVGNGNAVKNAPTTLSEGACIGFQFVADQRAWYRIR